jgi:hypothetical protein
MDILALATQNIYLTAVVAVVAFAIVGGLIEHLLKRTRQLQWTAAGLPGSAVSTRKLTIADIHNSQPNAGQVQALGAPRRRRMTR